MGETPTKEEIEKVIHSLPNKKAPGPDGIAAELLKKGGSTTVKMTTEIVQHIWATQAVPEQMSRALICLIPKKQGEKTP